MRDQKRTGHEARPSGLQLNLPLPYFVLPPAASSRGGDEDEEEGDEGKTQADPKKGEKGKRRRGKKKGGKEGEKEETILSKVIGFLN